MSFSASPRLALSPRRPGSTRRPLRGLHRKEGAGDSKQGRRNESTPSRVALPPLAPSDSPRSKGQAVKSSPPATGSAKGFDRNSRVSPRRQLNPSIPLPPVSTDAGTSPLGLDFSHPTATTDDASSPASSALAALRPTPPQSREPSVQAPALRQENNGQQLEQEDDRNSRNYPLIATNTAPTEKQNASPGQSLISFSLTGISSSAGELSMFPERSNEHSPERSDQRHSVPSDSDLENTWSGALSAEEASHRATNSATTPGRTVSRVRRLSVSLAASFSGSATLGPSPPAVLVPHPPQSAPVSPSTSVSPLSPIEPRPPDGAMRRHSVHSLQKKTSRPIRRLSGANTRGVGGMTALVETDEWSESSGDASRSSLLRPLSPPMEEGEGEGDVDFAPRDEAGGGARESSNAIAMAGVDDVSPRATVSYSPPKSVPARWAHSHSGGDNAPHAGDPLAPVAPASPKRSGPPSPKRSAPPTPLRSGNARRGGSTTAVQVAPRRSSADDESDDTDSAESPEGDFSYANVIVSHSDVVGRERDGGLRAAVPHPLLRGASAGSGIEAEARATFYTRAVVAAAYAPAAGGLHRDEGMSPTSKSESSPGADVSGSPSLSPRPPSSSEARTHSLSPRSRGAPLTRLAGVGAPLVIPPHSVSAGSVQSPTSSGGTKVGSPGYMRLSRSSGAWGHVVTSPGIKEEGGAMAFPPSPASKSPGGDGLGVANPDAVTVTVPSLLTPSEKGQADSSSSVASGISRQENSSHENSAREGAPDVEMLAGEVSGIASDAEVRGAVDAVESRGANDSGHAATPPPVVIVMENLPDGVPTVTEPRPDSQSTTSALGETSESIQRTIAGARAEALARGRAPLALLDIGVLRSTSEPCVPTLCTDDIQVVGPALGDTPSPVPRASPDVSSLSASDQRLAEKLAALHQQPIMSRFDSVAGITLTTPGGQVEDIAATLDAALAAATGLRGIAARRRFVAAARVVSLSRESSRRWQPQRQRSLRPCLMAAEAGNVLLALKTNVPDTRALCMLARLRSLMAERRAAAALLAAGGVSFLVRFVQQNESKPLVVSSALRLLHRIAGRAVHRLQVMTEAADLAANYIRDRKRDVPVLRMALRLLQSFAADEPEPLLRGRNLVESCMEILTDRRANTGVQADACNLLVSLAMDSQVAHRLWQNDCVSVIVRAIHSNPDRPSLVGSACSLLISLANTPVEQVELVGLGTCGAVHQALQALVLLERHDVAAEALGRGATLLGILIPTVVEQSQSTVSFAAAIKTLSCIIEIVRTADLQQACLITLAAIDDAVSASGNVEEGLWDEAMVQALQLCLQQADVGLATETLSFCKRVTQRLTRDEFPDHECLARSRLLVESIVALMARMPTHGAVQEGGVLALLPLFARESLRHELITLGVRGRLGDRLQTRLLSAD